MRPGFYIPECQSKSSIWATIGKGFNEAGILHPGMPGPCNPVPQMFLGFNEAGILHPGMPRMSSLVPVAMPLASMRPGFYIPECNSCTKYSAAKAGGFNEAGILHPGMRRIRRANSKRRRSFNEAGILHPGMLRIDLDMVNVVGASMRPGFYIPECPERLFHRRIARRASMRPGFYIPECRGSLQVSLGTTAASMRPGFYIPECPRILTHYRKMPI